MKKSLLKKTSDKLHTLLVIPIVLLLIISFLMLTNDVLLDLAKEKMELKSNACADDMEFWSEQIINQLNIYKDVLEMEGELTPHTVDVLTASYGEYDGYPFGLYWGDENKNFYDVSGWIPGPEFDPTKRGWFSEGLSHTDSFEFGEPYLDAKTGKTAVGVSVKVNCTDVVTVIASDVYFDYVTELVENLTNGDIDGAFLVTEKASLIIADSNWNMTGKTLDDDIDSNLYKNIKELLDKNFIGITSIDSDDGYYVNVCYVDNLNGFLVTYMEKKDMIKNVVLVSRYIFLIGIIASIILIILLHRTSVKMSNMTQLAQTDPLTKMLNRTGFNSIARPALRKSENECALLIFDVDNFKKINDELGHPTGDSFLKELSALIEGYFNRNTDVCARLGGDEFAVFMDRRISDSELQAMLKKFIELFHNTFDNEYADQKLSVSIGAAFSMENDHSMDRLYQRADKALYQAKDNGKNTYVIA